MQCLICKSESIKQFSKRIMNSYDVAYFKCSSCGFIQTERPYWLKEAYKNPINKSDTGYVSRNVRLSKTTSFVYLALFGKSKLYLDYGGGYGVLTRLMRDYGLNFFWSDPYTENLFAKGFEYSQEQKIAALTSFECFEHFAEPMVEIKKMMAISKNILFSTDLVPNDTVPDPDSWYYYGFNHGQHIALYTEKSLRFVARELGVFFYTNGENIHFFSEKKRSNFLFKIILLLDRISPLFFLKIFIKSRTMEDSVSLTAQINNLLR